MEDAALPSRSGHCLRSAHERCSHLAGLEPVRLWRPRPRSEWTHGVCVCDCHAECPLTGRRTVDRAVWNRRCTCPGAAVARAREQREDERRREMTAVHAAARSQGERDAAAIERRLRAVFEHHGEEPPPGLAAASRVAAATNARRGTRTARLLWMGITRAGAAIRWAWQRPPDDRSADDRAQARRTYRAVGAIATAAAALTVAAARATGWRRLPWGAGAAVTWLAAGIGVTVGTALTQLSRSVGEQPGTPTTG